MARARTEARQGNCCGSTVLAEQPHLLLEIGETCNHEATGEVVRCRELFDQVQILRGSLPAVGRLAHLMPNQ